MAVTHRPADCADINKALLMVDPELAVSTAILLEYEEGITRLSGRVCWSQIAELFEHLEALHGTFHRRESAFQFRIITADPDDKKFVDCAIAAQADFTVTDDQHFSVLKNSGYAPRVVTLEGLRDELLRRKLGGK